MKDKAEKYDLWHHYMSYRKDLYRIIQPHNIEAGMISESIREGYWYQCETWGYLLY